MKKFFSAFLALLMCLCTALPAMASAPSFRWNATEFCSTFNPILYNFINESTTWKSPDANTRIGTFANSPVIRISSENGKVTSISAISVLSAFDDEDTAYAKNEGLWFSMVTCCSSAAIFNDYDILTDMDVQEQMYEIIGTLYNNAFEKPDYSKAATVYTQTITFCDIDITCHTFWWDWTSPTVIIFTMVPSN